MTELHAALAARVTGDLRSDHLGAITVIPEADVERRLSLQPGGGRRLTTPNAWGVLAMASGERASWLSPDTRYRLRRLLDKHGLPALRARLVERGRPHGFRAHPSLLRAIRDDDALYVSMWLQHAEHMLRKGRVQDAADGLARALDGAIHRTTPRLVDRRDRQVSRDEQMKALRGMSHGGPVRTGQEPLARAIEGLSDWVLPLALGLPPSGYAATREVIGYESRTDMSGSPIPVDRPHREPTLDDVRRAAASVSVMIFQLWATGTLEPGRRDDEIMRLAEPFVKNPRGISAGDRGMRTPHPDKPDMDLNGEPI